MDKLDTKRIFIGGCPRSGTTLLQSMLTMNEHIHTFPETHYFRLGVGRKGSSLYSIVHRIIFLCKHEINFVSIFSTNAFMLNVIRRLDTKASNKHKTIWLEKTPEHLFYFERIKTFFPDSKFIIIYRDPLQTISSVINMWTIFRSKKNRAFQLKSLIMDFLVGVWKCKKLVNAQEYGIVYRAYQLWTDSKKAALKYSSTTNFTFACSYDDLVMRPKSTLRKICVYLDIEFTNNMLHPENNKQHIIEQNEIWKDNNKKPITTKISSKFNQLTDLQKKYLEELIARKRL